MNKKLYILPFDHRSSFLKNILKTSQNPTKKDLLLAQKLKEIIFKGFLMSLKDFKNKKDFAILVDEKLGQSVLNKAKKEKIKICLPVEKSGESFDFEYGQNFQKHIKKISPDFVKALIRYNPDNLEENKKQLKKLSKLSIFCQKNKYNLLIELLVPPTKENLKNFGSQEYDQKIRPIKTEKAIQEILSVASPVIWKLEGMETKDWPKIIKIIGKAKIIVLGRGESDEHVKKWLSAAAKFKEIIGFAVGRTIFMEALKRYLAKEISENEASLWIATKFSFFVNLWQIQKNKQ